MLNDQLRPSDHSNLTALDIYPQLAGASNALASDLRAKQSRGRDEVVRQPRFNIGGTMNPSWYGLGMLGAVLGMGYFLEHTAMNIAAQLVKLSLAFSHPSSWSFNGSFPIPWDGNIIFDPRIIFAIDVVALIAWRIARHLATTTEPPPVT
jgi:hypothetical protein